MKRIVLVWLVLALAACSKEKTETTAAITSAGAAAATAGQGNTKTTELAVGSEAPDFSAKSHDGKDVRLSGFRGRPVVVYFYPKDETPGCTKQACGFRDAWAEMDKKGVVLIGVSGDTDESHRKFAQNHKLPFSLVSDPDGKIAAQFGVPFRMGFASRHTIVIAPDGKVKKIYRDVDVTTHAKDVLADVS